MADFLQLLHTTSDMTPDSVRGKSKKQDKDILRKALWVSARTSEENCCQHHQERTVAIKPKAFGKCGDVHGKNQLWSLFFVKTTTGSARNHTFAKFVLAPKSFDYINQGSAEAQGPDDWDHVADLEFDSRFLGSFYKSLQEELFLSMRKKHSTNFNWAKNDHVHIGILGLQAITDFREVKQGSKKAATKMSGTSANNISKSTAAPSNTNLHEPASDEDDEFEYNECQEIDDEREETMIKHVKKNGCIKFCKDPSVDFFPVSDTADAAFQHYCRAFCVWKCKRKSCSNTWTSAWCWFNINTENGSQKSGARKGFENQYCNKCWRKAEREKLPAEEHWVNGKVASFKKPDDTRAVIRKGFGKRNAHPHDQAICQVCQNLRAQGFERGCNTFSRWTKQGKIKVSRSGFKLASTR
ncbi:unnamed protein product [Amoebophrya sp. A120]|nr:unnamed protein product [Amoebophrya sp. A120]|eukprot:GSA120T00018325001.1